MQIGILADSHDNLPNLYKAVEIFNQRGVSHVFHAGDFVSPFTAKPLSKLKCSMRGVFGNNDGDKLLLREKFNGIGEIHEDFYEDTIDDKSIVVIHKEKLVEKLAQSRRYDVIIYGHTHKVDVREGHPLIVNPGECGGWLGGRSTIAIFDTDKFQVEVIQLK